MNLMGGHNDQNTFHEILEELVTNFNKELGREQIEPD